MSGTVYALLVGINDYGGKPSPLRGCRADVEALDRCARGSCRARRAAARDAARSGRHAPAHHRRFPVAPRPSRAGRCRAVRLQRARIVRTGRRAVVVPRADRAEPDDRVRRQPQQAGGRPRRQGAQRAHRRCRREGPARRRRPGLLSLRRRDARPQGAAQRRGRPAGATGRRGAARRALPPGCPGSRRGGGRGPAGGRRPPRTARRAVGVRARSAVQGGAGRRRLAGRVLCRARARPDDAAGERVVPGPGAGRGQRGAQPGVGPGSHRVRRRRGGRPGRSSAAPSSRVRR